jgi:adenylate kinase
MDWLCKPGLPEKIDLVKAEFAKERNLRPVKILIMGPPCAGKSFYAEQVAQHYNIPHIHMQKLLQELLEWDQEKDDRYKKRVAEREVKIEELKKQRALQEVEDSKKKASSVVSQEAKEDGEGDGEDGGQLGAESTRGRDSIGT